MKTSPRKTTGFAALAALCWAAGMLPARAQEGDSVKPAVTDSSAAEALAAANLELESLREELSRTRLQIEALGLAALDPVARAIQERLARALGELSVSRRSVRSLTESNEQLLEAGAALVADPQSPSSRSVFQQVMKRAGETRRKATEAPSAPSLESARVVSYKSELSLAVVSAGRLAGLRPGTPMVVRRGDQVVASGLVVDIRDNVAGLLITGAQNSGVRAGDSVRPRTDSNPSEQ
jgi:hypothetical protein